MSVMGNHGMNRESILLVGIISSGIISIGIEELVIAMFFYDDDFFTSRKIIS